MNNFYRQWKSVIPDCAIKEIHKLLVHVRKGCLSGILPSGGTSRNEGIHKVLNKTLRKSRIGIQFALALLGIFFYAWNEKRITAVKDQGKVRVTPPIESHFENNQEEFNDHLFGISNDYVAVSKTSDYSMSSEYSNIRPDNSEAEIVNQLNNFLNHNLSDVSSDEDESSSSENNSPQPPTLPNLNRQQQDKVVNSAKGMKQLYDHIQTITSCKRFTPNFCFFPKVAWHSCTLQI